MAAIYSVVGGLIFAIGGASEVETFLLVVTYFSAGVVSGFLLGLGKRLAMRSRALSMVLGVVIAIPPATMFSLMEPEQSTFGDHAVVVLMTAVPLGLWGGWYFGPGGPGYSGDTSTD